jgi:ComF family protein
MKQAGTYFRDLLTLVYPELCAACANYLYKGEEVICTVCRHSLPYTSFESHAGNPVEKLFWGRVPISSAASLLFFRKGSRVQHLLHELKYKRNRAVGVRMGELMGLRLSQTERFSTADILLPVPLHPAKIRQRGYNQAGVIVEGMASSMNKMVDEFNFRRMDFTESQTRKSRYARYENMKDVFTIRDEEAFRNKHFILVDDVITTGATIEACAQCLLKVPGVKVSVVSLASA